MSVRCIGGTTGYKGGTKGMFCYLKRVFCYLKTEFCYFKQQTPTFLSAISAIMFHAKTSQTHDIPNKLRYWIPWTWKGHVVPAKNKYADSKSSAYLRGTWLKTKKYQTVILAYLRYISTRIIAPCCCSSLLQIINYIYISTCTWYFIYIMIAASLF
jgi:hypothetical protein